MRISQSLISLLLLILIAGCGAYNGDCDESGVGNVTLGIRNGVVDTTGAFSNVLRLSIDTGNGGTLCSSTVVSPRAILTAAHCVESLRNNSASSIFVRTPSGAIRRGSEVVIHPNYVSEDFGSADLAIVLFDDDLGAVPAELSTVFDLSDNQTVTGVGFGQSEESQSGTRRSGTSQFLGTFASRLADGSVDREQGNIAVIPGEDNQIICSGDSGGPLFSDGKVVGVAAFVTFNNSSSAGILIGNCAVDSEVPTSGL